MKTKLLRKTLAVAVVSAFAAYSVQASALSLSFDQNTGFVVDNTLLSNGSAGSKNNDIVWYASSGDAPTSPISPTGQTFGTIAWGLPATNQNLGQVAFNPFSVGTNSDNRYSGLRVAGLSGNITENWTSISTIFHHNSEISGSASVLQSANIFSDLHLGIGSNQNTVAITGFLESTNANPCPTPNPLGSTCDDRFTFDFSGFAPFIYDDGSVRYLVEFQLGNVIDASTNFPNCPGGSCSVWTREFTTSSIDVQARISEIPEPTTLALFSLGLLGLAGLKRRAKAEK